MDAAVVLPAHDVHMTVAVAAAVASQTAATCLQQLLLKYTKYTDSVLSWLVQEAGNVTT